MNTMQEASYRPRAPLWLACALAFACVLLYVLLITGCGPSPAEPRPDPEPPPGPELEAAVKLLPFTVTTDVNAVRRQERGRLERLEWDERLAAVAWTQALYMRHLDRLTHDRPAELTMARQLAAVHYRASTWGENVAYTMEPDDAAWEAVLRLWKDSPGHYANMVNPDFRHLGVAAVRSEDGKRIYVCMVLGAPAVEQVSLPEPLRDIDSTAKPSEQ